MAIEDRPARSRAWLWWALAATYLASNLRQRVGYYDEGYALYGAWRTLEGALPYRDFWTNYGPGSFCVNALAMALLGKTVLALRTFDLFIRLGIAWSCGRLAVRAGAGRWAWFAAGTALCLLGPLGFFGYAGHLGLLLALFCSLAWLKSQDGGGRAWALGAGLLAGVAAFVRQDFGAYLAAAMAAHSLAAAWLGRRPGAWARLAWAAAGAMAAGAALFAPYLWLAGPGTLWQALVAQNFGLVHGLYSEPWPALSAMVLSLRGLAHGDLTALDPGQPWVAVYVGGALLLDLLAASLRRLRRGGPLALEGLWIALLGCLLLRQGLNRPDTIHLYPCLLLAVSAAAVQAGLHGLGRAKAAAWLLGLYFMAAPLSAWARYLVRLPSLPSSRLERSAGLPVAADMDAAVDLVQRATQPGDRIYVANASAGQGLINNALFYFLADRPCAVRDELVLRPEPPGFEQEIEDALDRPSTGAVVLWNGLGTGLGSGPLDQRLQAFGTGPVYGIGDFKVRFRRPMAP
jgi:hypothetical protein